LRGSVSIGPEPQTASHWTCTGLANLIPLQGLVNAARGKAEDDCGIFLTRYSLGKGAHSAITRMTITGTRGTPDT